jgi:predicted DNA-binding antitoxin AbrB/MazE fold protein
MEGPHVIIPGIVQNGVIVPTDATQLPEGTTVEIVVARLEFTPELRAEFDAWEQLSAESWSRFLEWEKEELAKEQQP